MKYIKFKTDCYKFKLLLESGDGEEYPGCSFTASVFGRGIEVILPQWVLNPHAEKVKALGWSEKDIERMGRDFYWNYTERRYGIYCYEDHLNVVYGAESDSSRENHRWSMFLPWKQWRMVRHSLYGLNGEEVYKEGSKTDWKKWDAARDEVPKRHFAFKDYDGEGIVASTYVEERQWKKGKKWCSFLSLFTSDKVERSLDIWFSAETGARKGSWKGGTTGHGITMKNDESHEAAFRRYCIEHAMTFIGECGPPPERTKPVDDGLTVNDCVTGKANP